jgi:putative FmdB family regulatory protein
MPTYDYICSSCGRTTEIVHSINSGPPAACPACGAIGTLSKGFNPPTVHFKGSGWAKKDRGSGRPKPAAAPESSPAKGSGGEGDSSAVGQGDADVKRPAAKAAADAAAAKDAPDRDGPPKDTSSTAASSSAVD